ncbi:MAG TPA: hypothetical protein VN753_10285 [Terracidiphilus sp.]|nr:hypothetical protein [Terracidiphilus sp.]
MDVFVRQVLDRVPENLKGATGLFCDSPIPSPAALTLKRMIRYPDPELDCRSHPLFAFLFDKRFYAFHRPVLRRAQLPALAVPKNETAPGWESL